MDWLEYWNPFWQTDLSCSRAIQDAEWWEEKPTILSVLGIGPKQMSSFGILICPLISSVPIL